MSRQAAAHSDHITEVLKVQERELGAKFQVQLSEHIQKEKETFQQQVASWVARLRGIEAAIDSKSSQCIYYCTGLKEECCVLDSLTNSRCNLAFNFCVKNKFLFHLVAIQCDG